MHSIHRMNPLLLKAFLLISKVQIYRKAHPYLLNTLRILELIFLSYLMLFSFYLPLTYPLYISHSILSLILLPLTLLYLYLTPSRMQLNEWKYFTDVIFNAINAISLVLQLLFLPFLLSLQFILESALQYLPLALCSIILITLVLLFDPSSHLFGRIMIPLIYLYYLTNSPLCFLFSIFYIPQQTLLLRLIYTIIGVLAIEATLLQQQTLMNQSRYVQCFTVLVMCVGIAVLYREETDLSTALKENMFVFEAIREHMGDSVEESIDRTTQFTIEKILWRSPFKQDEVRKMTVLAVWELLVAKIKHDLAKSTSFELALLEMQVKQLQKRDRFMGILKDCTFLCQSFLSKATLSQKYALYLQVVHLEAAYLLSEDGSYPVLVVEAEMQTKIFYSQLQLCINSLIGYWKGIRQENEEDCNAKILKLLALQGQLHETLKKVSSFKNSPKERKLLALLGELLDNCSVPDNLDQHSETQPTITTIDYLIVENDLIVKVSFQLLLALGIKEPNIIREKKEIIFPKLIGDYIDAHMDEYVSNGQSLLLPIMTYSRHIVLKKCRLYIFPELFNGIKYMYSFQNCSSNNIILYDRSADQIINTSQLFFNTIDDYGDDCAPTLANRRTSRNIPKISTSVIQIGKINNQSTPINICNSSSHETFNDLDLTSEETYLFLLANKCINTQLHVKRFIRSTHHRLSNIKVTLQLQTSFQVLDHHLYVLSIEQGRIVKVNNKISIKEPSKQIQYQHQTFFCPIPNAYETVLTETLLKIKHSPSISNLFILKLLFHFSLFAAFCAIMLSISLANTRVTVSSACLSSGMNINEQYSNITMNYFRAYLIDYLRLTNLSLPVITIDQISRVYSSTHQTLQNIYTSSNETKPFVPYIIQYPSFNVSTNSNEISIVDFLQLIQQSIQNVNISLLLLNYQTFVSLKQSYNIDGMYEFQYSSTIQLQSINYLLALSIIAILTVCSYYHALQVEKVLSHLSLALSMISPEEISTLLDNIYQLKNSINRDDTQEPSFTRDKQDVIIQSDESEDDSLQGDSFAGVLIDTPMANSSLSSSSNSSSNSSLNNSSYYSSLNNSSLNNSSVNNSLARLRNSSMRNSSIRLLKQKNANRNKEEAGLAKLTAEINIPVVFLNNIVYLLFFIFFLATALSYFQIILPQQIESTGSLFRYLNDIYSSVHSNNQLLLKAFHYPLYHSYFNHSLQFTPSQFSNRFESSLPSFFQPYSSQLFLNQDFCTFKSTELLITQVKCEDVFEGIIKNGMGQVWYLYSFNADIIANTSLNLLSEIRRIKAPYPTYIELIYTRDIIYIGLKNYVNVFLTAARLYGQARMRNVYLLGGLLGVMLGVFVYIGRQCHKKTKERCRVAMKCFSLIPKECILKMKNTQFMRENQLLETLEKL